MNPATSCTLALEAGMSIALTAAAMLGDASLQPNGLHVPQLAYDNIGFTILAVCVLSCVLAAVQLGRVAQSWNRVEALGFLAAAMAWATRLSRQSGIISKWQNLGDRVDDQRAPEPRCRLFPVVASGTIPRGPVIVFYESTNMKSEYETGELGAK